MLVESEVSKYIRNHISFVVFSVEDKKERLRLETGIIASLAQDGDFKSSINWFGHFSPEQAIRNSGLWLKQHLTGNILLENEYIRLKEIVGK